MSDDYGKPLPIIGSGLEHLDEKGEALRMYFTFMYQFMLVSILCGGLAIAQAVICFRGGFYKLDEENTDGDLNRLLPPEYLKRMQLVTIANFHGYSNYTKNEAALNWVDENY